MRLGVRLTGALVGESARADAEANPNTPRAWGAREVAVERQYKQHAVANSWIRKRQDRYADSA